MKGLSAAKVEIPKKQKPAPPTTSPIDAMPSNGTQKKRSLEDDGIEVEPGDAKKRRLDESKSVEDNVLVLDDGAESGAIVID